ncbi:MAG: SWIM zinc finger family protein, partial [Phycicoccus sp.]
MARVLAVDHLADLTNRDLGELCGTVTVARGLAYVRQGRVLDLDLAADGAVATGYVGGSNGETYTTRVALVPAEQAPPRGSPRAPRRRWSAGCSCPVGSDCKHAVAVVATVRDSAPHRARTGEERPSWEWALGGLLEDGSVDSDITAVGLLVAAARSGPGRPERSSSAPAQLAVRPVIPGARSAWVRTGVSWETFAGGYYGSGRQVFPDEHRDALTSLADAHRRSVRAFGYGR